MAFFDKLFGGLAKTRAQIDENLSEVFMRETIDDDFYDDLEELLILSDIGVVATENIIEQLRLDAKAKHIKTPAGLGTLLMDTIREQMNTCVADYEFEEKKSVVLVVGVNGVGKTTTIG